ncbi:embryonic skeletal system development [Paramarasmius palmivorus]|uniref:Embryonic skeletal system development n=1 Tax=Paramarasmius palmivorus TaxID=297713 RepID=A0AAW0E0U6_9AGAR
MSRDTEPSRYDDPSTKIWNVYLTEVEKDDEKLAANWKGDMDAILIFAGLFSASVTAFIVESYKTLIPDNSDTTNQLLERISIQLAAANNGSFIPQTVPDSTSFEPSPSSIVCNTLWFLSLGFSLTCALFATLVQQWTRSYRQATSSRESPHQRARISAYLYQGISKFHMSAIVTAIPMLLHISLLLFFAGLVEFLRPVNETISLIVLFTLTICGLLYGIITFLPLFHFDCPYQTPLTNLCWRLFRSLGLIRRTNSQGISTPVSYSQNKARELEATEISPKRDQRDFNAICWAMESLQEDTELEPFVEVIPGVVSGFDYSAKLLLYRLLDHHDIAIRLGYRIPRLLASCAEGQIEMERARRRAVICLSAIWWLTMMDLPRQSSVLEGQSANTAPVYLSRETLRFDEQTLRFIKAVRKAVSGLGDHCVSAATVVARSMLDMFHDQSVELEEEINNFLRTRQWNEERLALVSSAEARVTMNVQKSLGHTVRRIVNLEKQLLSSDLASKHSMTSPLFHMNLDGFVHSLEELVTFVALISSEAQASESNDHSNTDSFALDAVSHIRNFRRVVERAGYLLVLEYISYIVGAEEGFSVSSSSSNLLLPYEGYNTLRRLYLRLNVGATDYGVTATSTRTRSGSLSSSMTLLPTDSTNYRHLDPPAQQILVSHFTAAVEYPGPEMHRKDPIERVQLPAGILNLLLSLVGRAIDDPGCAHEAKRVVEWYLDAGVGVEENLDAAKKVAEVLGEKAKGVVK